MIGDGDCDWYVKNIIHSNTKQDVHKINCYFLFPFFLSLFISSSLPYHSSPVAFLYSIFHYLSIQCPLYFTIRCLCEPIMFLRFLLVVLPFPLRIMPTHKSVLWPSKPQMPFRKRTRAGGVGTQRLTAWATARTYFNLLSPLVPRPSLPLMSVIVTFTAKVCGYSFLSIFPYVINLTYPFFSSTLFLPISAICVLSFHPSVVDVCQFWHEICQWRQWIIFLPLFIPLSTPFNLPPVCRACRFNSFTNIYNLFPTHPYKLRYQQELFDRMRILNLKAFKPV
jgi:hypothetical protein